MRILLLAHCVLHTRLQCSVGANEGRCHCMPERARHASHTTTSCHGQSPPPTWTQLLHIGQHRHNAASAADLSGILGLCPVPLLGGSVAAAGAGETDWRARKRAGQQWARAHGATCACSSAGLPWPLLCTSSRERFRGGGGGGGGGVVCCGSSFGPHAARRDPHRQRLLAVTALMRLTPCTAGAAFVRCRSRDRAQHLPGRQRARHARRHRWGVRRPGTGAGGRRRTRWAWRAAGPGCPGCRASSASWRRCRPPSAARGDSGVSGAYPSAVLCSQQPVPAGWPAAVLHVETGRCWGRNPSPNTQQGIP